MVEAALQATQAWAWRDRSLGELSGGERQRVLLARALAGNAPLMLMDEPLANLDPPHQVDWLEQVHCLKAQGTTVVSVLHEIGMALHADDVVVMDAGTVVHHGPCDQAATREAIEAVFAGRIRILRADGQWVVLPRIA
jgi:iron complex transport system ATP-binding protein